ncbi:polysaccharide pyruvyl transferase family protein [Clostridium intestinale]|jgi:colanic acid/amylovoran biosynthesis protein|uniref:polysaccharide pyruvyl transferase family protein n=1 Tax=Clostridium intestinale TaxID=36845 RepID=UPI0028EE3AEB|nr:polysaccharide pyruvyl transferase family protein [Clostridium intestinale]
MKENIIENKYKISFAFLLILTLICGIFFNNIVQYLLLVVFVVLSVYLLRLRDEKVFLYINIFILFQNILLVILSKYINTTSFNIIILNKEAIVYLGVLIYFPLFIFKKKITLNLADKIAIIACIFFTLYLLIFPVISMKASLASYRQYLIIFVVYLFGRIIDLDEEKLFKVTKLFITIFLITVIFGFFEYIVGNKIWINMGISDYLAHKGNLKYINLKTGIPKSFYTYDLYFLLKVAMRRMASTLVDPVIYSQLVAYCFTIIFFCKNIFKNPNIRRIALIILAIGLTLTFGKGGVIILIISIVYGLISLKNKNKIIIYIIMITSVIIGLFVVINGIKANTSVARHLEGFTESFKVMFSRPQGYGIGVNGNFIKLFGADTFKSIGEGESFIGKVAVETGIIGLFLMITFFVALFKEINRKSYISKELNLFNITLSGLLIATFIASMFSVSVMSFTGCSFIIMIIGCVIRNMEANKKEKNDNTNLELGSKQISEEKMKIKLELIHPYNYGNLMMTSNYIQYTAKNSRKDIVFYMDLKDEDELERVRESISPELRNKVFKTNDVQKVDNKIVALLSYFKSTFKERKEYDSIVFLGGDCLSEYYSIKKFLLRSLKIYVSAKKIPVLLIGQTIGPFTSYRKLLTSICLKKSFISTRDRVCYKYLREDLKLNNICDSRDLAFLDLPQQDENRDNLLNKYNLINKEYITLVPSGLYKSYTNNREMYIKRYIEITEKLLSNSYLEGKRIVFLPHVVNCDTDDGYIINDIYEYFKNNDRILKIESPLMPQEARYILGNGLFTITGRMHAAVSTFQMGIPAISLSYSVKYKGVIGDGLDLNELIVECVGNDIWSNNDFSSIVMNKAEFVMKNYESITNKVNCNVNKSKELAILQINEALKIIE